MLEDEVKNRELKLFLALALGGVVAALFHVHIPHTDVLIDGRWAFGFMGFALLRRWWAALALAAFLSYPFGTPDIPLWTGLGGNLLYAVPSLLVIRPLSGWMQRRWGPGWIFGLGWLALVLLCYQAFVTPMVWGVIAQMEGRPLAAGIIDGWRTQPYLVESVLVALFSALAMVAVLAVQRLRAQPRRLKHFNRVLRGIRNVNQLIVSEDDPRRLIEQACGNLTETMGYHNSWIALLGGEAARALGLPEAGPVAASAAAGFDGGFKILRERLEQGTFPDCMSRALETGDVLVVSDPDADCHDCPLHGDYGGRSGLARRLEFDGVTYGILTGSVPAAFVRDPEEQELFSEVAGDLAFALHKIAMARRQKQSEQRLSLVIDGSGVGAWEWNVQTNETVFNEHWAAMLGYTLEELTPYDYATWERLTHPEDLERASEALTDCVEGRASEYSCELRMKHKDGHWVWILDRGRVLTHDDAGKALAMFGTHTDITEIKQAEEKARTEHDLSQSIIDHGPVGITIVNRDGVVEFANRLAQEILGLSESASQERTYNDPDWKITAVDGTQFPDDQLPVRRVLDTGEAVHDVQHAIEGPNGQRRILSINAAPLKNREGRIERIVCSIEDITERRQAEEALRESERRFQNMLGVVPDMISIHNPQMDILYSNWRGFAAVPEDKQVLNTKCYRTYRGLDKICPDCHAGLVLETGKPIQEEVELPDGTWVDLRVIPLLDEDNNVELFMEWVRDTTEHKQAEEALKQSLELLDATQQIAHVGGWEWDVERQTMTWSDETYRIHGMPPGAPPAGSPEHIDMSLACYDPADRPIIENAFQRCAAEGQSYDLELRLNRTDGRRIWIRTQAQAVQEDGRVVRVTGTITDITERKQAEEALRESEQRIQSIFRSAPVGIGVVSNRILMQANLRLGEMTGYSNEEMVGQSARMLYPSDEEFEYVGREKYRQISEHGTGTVETRFRRKDGVIIDTLLSSTPIDPSDLSRGVTFTALDITERKQAAEALLHSHELMQYIIEHANSAVAVHDRDLRYVYVSQRYLDDYNVQEENIIGRHHYDVFPDLPEKWREVHRKALAGEVSRSEKDPLERADGSVEWTRWECRPWYEEGGSIGGIVIYTEVITERVEAERALAEQQALLTAIYRNAPLVLMVVDGERRIQQVNGFASQFAGRPVEEMLGLRGGEALRCLHALESPEGCGFGEYCHQCVIRKTVLDTLDTGETHLQLEAPYFLQKDGETREMTLLLSTTPLAMKETRMALVTLQDITERKQAEEEREKLSAQLTQAQKLESVGRLAGGVAHDFNNMLNVILGHTELALGDLAADSPLRADLEEVQKAGERSANLTRQLLAFARKQTVAPKVLDLNETIASMLKMLQRLIGEDIDLLWKPGAPIAPVRIDTGQVDQVLANLVVNARDAIGHDNGKITIETKNASFDEDYCSNYDGFRPGDYVMLAVSDDGCGMDEETRTNIFEPFFTTKGVGDGTGLGLATVYGVVKQNDGFVNVYSEPGEGTTLRLYLPALAATAVHSIDIAARSEALERGEETILVVEDQPVLLELARKMLERLGYTVLTAATPSEALRVARDYDGKPDLLITDVVMPEMNGRALAEQLQVLCPGLKNLFMSGYTANVIAHQGVLDEGVNFLQKPFTLEDLAKKVREELES